MRDDTRQARQSRRHDRSGCWYSMSRSRAASSGGGTPCHEAMQQVRVLVLSVTRPGSKFGWWYSMPRGEAAKFGFWYSMSRCQAASSGSGTPCHETKQQVQVLVLHVTRPGSKFGFWYSMSRDQAASSGAGTPCHEARHQVGVFNTCMANTEACVSAP